MENTEVILHELSLLETETKEELSKVLEDYLVSIAKTGNTLLPWSKLRSLFRLKLEAVIKEYQESSPIELVPKMPNVEPFRFEEMKQRIFEQEGNFEQK
jgi:serine/threonine-protein phosphatase 4 regulatory subunit 2